MQTFPVYGMTVTKSITPIITSSLVYSTGHRLGEIQNLTDVFFPARRWINGLSDRQQSSNFQSHLTLQSLKVIDSSLQSQPLRLFFFNSLPTVASADRTAFQIVAAEASKCVGVVDFSSPYYSTGTGGFSVAEANYIGSTAPQIAANVNDDLWVVAQIQGAATFTSTTALRFIYTFYLD